MSEYHRPCFSRFAAGPPCCLSSQRHLLFDFRVVKGIMVAASHDQGTRWEKRFAPLRSTASQGIQKACLQRRHSELERYTAGAQYALSGEALVYCGAGSFFRAIVLSPEASCKCLIDNLAERWIWPRTVSTFSFSGFVQRGVRAPGQFCNQAYTQGDVPCADCGELDDGSGCCSSDPADVPAQKLDSLEEATCTCQNQGSGDHHSLH